MMLRGSMLLVVVFALLAAGAISTTRAEESPAPRKLTTVRTEVSRSDAQVSQQRVPASSTRRREVTRRTPDPQRLRAAKQRSSNLPQVRAQAASRPSGDRVGPAAAVNELGPFEGIEENGFNPPDPAIAVSNNQTGGQAAVLLATNSLVRTAARSGAQVGTDRTLLQWFASLSPSTDLIYQSRAVYQGGHVYLVALLFNENTSESKLFISVSQGAGENLNFTAGWCNQQVDTNIEIGGVDTIADYPKLGATSNRVYVSTNQFDASDNFEGSLVFVFNKAQLDSCTPQTADVFGPLLDGGSNPIFDVVPALDYDPSGSTRAWFVHTDHDGGDTATVWSFDVSGETFSSGQVLDTLPYSVPPNASQPSTSALLDTGDSRAATAVRRYGTTWVVHPTGLTINTTDSAGLHWMAINTPNDSATPSLQQDAYHQEGPGNHLYMPAMSVDVKGNAALAYNRSSSSEFPSIRAAARMAYYQHGTLMPSLLLSAGANFQQIQSSAWGNYTGFALDSRQPRRFWYLAEYGKNTDFWGTKWGAFLIQPDFLHNLTMVPGGPELEPLAVQPDPAADGY
jgi:hypothetical protein